MRIYVVHPGATFSTHDVYDGVVWGLRAGGHAVLEGRLDSALAWYQAAAAAGAAAGTMRADATDAATLGLSALASAPITRHILMTRPEWVLVISGHNYNAHDVAALRRHGYKAALLLTESPYFGDTETALARVGSYDLVLTNEARSVGPLAAALDAPVRYLRHAYHPERHTPAGPAAAPCDVAFIGTLFDERRPLIAALRAAGLHVVCRGYDPQTQTPDLVPNAETAAIYRGARIVLNHHRTTTMHGSGGHIAADAAESLGPRAYEAAACGAFQLMDDRRAEARALFGAALATYDPDDPATLVAAARRWLADDAGRAACAAQQRAAMAPHHWGNRAAELAGYLAEVG